MSERAEIVVVGGGISGLSAALALHQAGRDVHLVEASGRFGGVIHTERVEGFVIEAGPDSILAQKPEGIALCRAVGLGERLIPTNPETRTIFVARGSRLHALPEGMMLAVPTRVFPFLRSRLFSWPGKLRMGLDLVLPRGGAGGDESIASLLRRRFGEEAVERLGEPLMAGIHAGDPERLSIRATFPRFVELEARHRSLIRGMWAARPRAAGSGSAFYSLVGGLAELVDAVVERIPAARRHLHSPVAALSRGADGFHLSLAGGRILTARAVVLAVPAPAAAPLVASLSPEAAPLLADIPFASSATVALGYRRRDVAHPLDGYGLLVPRGEGLRASACTFVSTKFASRAPDGHVLLRVFLGGTRDPDVLGLDDAALAALAGREMSPLLGLRGDPVLVRVHRWPRATPQMEVGHLDRMARLEGVVSGVAGLFLTGAGLRGTGLPDSIADGQRTAAAAAASVSAGATAGAVVTPQRSV
ncbi:MAG TPA: protoporphyrinogen oxidase [Vicinamibacteria bacterium]|nr:protoporphyrinogen oxidase [Vicinamibacteria bacterium]